MTDGSHVNRHTLPCCVKQLVAVEEGGYSSLALARQQFQEWSEIFRTHNFSRKRTVEKVQVVNILMVAGGLKGHDRTGGTGRVNEVQRSAK